MKKISFDEFIPDKYKPYYLFAGGIILIYGALFFKSKKNGLVEAGVETEGIVFSQDGVLDISRSTTVRFVTENMEWITGKIDQDFQLSYISQYKNGDKVKVYYDKNNPYDFYITTKQNHQKGRIWIAIVGLAVIGFGMYLLLTA